MLLHIPCSGILSLGVEVSLYFRYLILRCLLWSCFFNQQKVENADKLVEPVDPELKKKVLDYRRSVVLALVGGTTTETPSLVSIVAGGYLIAVKLWLDDILAAQGMKFGFFFSICYPLNVVSHEGRIFVSLKY
jgi:hypothetical protein